MNTLQIKPHISESSKAVIHLQLWFMKKLDSCKIWKIITINNKQPKQTRQKHLI